jgi:hypothetical protein
LRMLVSSRTRLYQSISTMDLDIGGEDHPMSSKCSLHSKTQWTRTCKYIGICSAAIFATIIIFAFGGLAGYQLFKTLRNYAPVESGKFPILHDGVTRS